jgi:hypothetical protein
MLHLNPPLGSTLLHATREPVGDATIKTSIATLATESGRAKATTFPHLFGQLVQVDAPEF